MAIKTIQAKFAGKCHYCGLGFPAQTTVLWDSLTKAVYHGACAVSLGLLGPVPVVTAVTPEGAPVFQVAAGPSVASAGPVPVSGILEKLKAKKAAMAAKTATAAPAKPKVKTPVPVPVPADMTDAPKTQKARGIVALQKHKMLSAAFARVAQTEDQAVTYATAQGFPCFVRPCPTVPRHGFVDSRVVHTVEDVKQVWGETMAEDLQGELIVMPYVDADFNMVWRPGLLAVGPGHDGATAGKGSISIFLQPQWSKSGIWQTVSTDAGVDLSKDDPFIEAVSAGGSDTVVTQIRAGVKGTVTAPDWNPEPFVIGEVITIASDTKADPDAMLAWETRAKELIPGHHVVYNPGGNLGDHWSVHAQIAKIPVVTTFCPKVGDLLPKLGLDLVPLDPQAVLWGFLGGVAGPSLKSDLGARKRAVCAAVCGVHHGMRFGGDAGVHIGASVAFLLRLAQAAVWGEARHAEHSGLSRDQVYKAVLDDWLTGREQFAKKVSLMHTHHWHGGFGGSPWAAIGHGTIALDRAVLDLLADPTEARAGALVARLNALVNLAHNNGWFLNKFSEATWFDLAADLDPRAAIMAGPAWYEATTVPADVRMALLTRLETLTPIAVTFKAPNGKAVNAKAPHGSVNMGAGSGSGSHVGTATANKKTGTGSGMFDPDGAPLPFAVVDGLAGAQMKAGMGGHGSQGHLQVITDAAGHYISGSVAGLPVPVMAEIQDGDDTTSAGGTGTKYFKLAVNPATGQIQTTEGTVIAVVTLTKGGKA